MKKLSSHLSRLSPSRRKFLKATASLAGVTVLGSLNLDSLVLNVEKKEMKSTDFGTKQEKMFNIRAHHLFCMLEAIGTGKSSHKTMGPIEQKIRVNPKTPLKIVIGMDDICSPCKWWNHDEGRCMNNIDKYPHDNEDNITCDKNTIRVLGIKVGDEMNADDIYRLIKTKVTRKVFKEVACSACRLVNTCAKTYEAKIEAAVKTLS